MFYFLLLYLTNVTVPPWMAGHLLCQGYCGRKQQQLLCYRNQENLITPNPEAYRPISLLNTIDKVLEAVMARRRLYYVKIYGLLPNTQFERRPRQSTEQALLVLANENRSSLAEEQSSNSSSVRP